MDKYMINGSYESKITFKFLYNEETTFYDLKKYLNSDSDFFAIAGIDIYGDEIWYYFTFPYIIGKNNVIWNQSVLNTKIVDFTRTFGLSYLKINDIPDGIGDLISVFDFEVVISIIKSILNTLWKYREQISYFCTLFEITNTIRKYLKKYKDKTHYQIPASDYFYSILIKSDWDIVEFMKKYSLDRKISTCVLELLGYKYIKSRNLYHISKNEKNKTLKVVDKIFSEFNDKICS